MLYMLWIISPLQENLARHALAEASSAVNHVFNGLHLFSFTLDDIIFRVAPYSFIFIFRINAGKCFTFPKSLHTFKTFLK